MIWLDTQTHIDWFAKEFKVPASKFRRLWVGADDEVMKPQPRPVAADQQLTIFFYGKFIPLQGIEHIIDAAALIEREDERIRFVLCGRWPDVRADARAGEPPGTAQPRVRP